MAGSFYVGGFAPKCTTPDQLLPYCKRISANVKHPSVPYTYAFIVPNAPAYQTDALKSLNVAIFKSESVLILGVSDLKCRNF